LMGTLVRQCFRLILSFANLYGIIAHLMKKVVLRFWLESFFGILVNRCFRFVLCFARVDCFSLASPLRRTLRTVSRASLSLDLCHPTGVVWDDNRDIGRFS